MLDTGSETSRLVHRDAELRNVGKCLRDSHCRSTSNVPAGSRFQEVISDNPRFAIRKSLISKLELTLPMDYEIFVEKFDGNDSENDHLASAAAQKSQTRNSGNLDRPDHGHLKVPSTRYDRAKFTGNGVRLTTDKHVTPRARGFSSSRDGDETAEMWKRALRAESVSNPARRSTSTQRFVTQPSPPAVKINSQLPRAPCPSEIGNLSGSNSLMHSPTCTELPTQEDEETFRQSLVRSNIVLEEWSRQLGQEDQEPTTTTYGLPSEFLFVHKNRKTPPASWATFPSHTREQRNATAGELDSVKSRDFAMREVSAVGKITWTTGLGDDGAPSQKSVVRSVSDRFTQPFKSRWSRLVPERLGSSVKDRSIRGARRSSIQASGDLEYPELELLPTAGGYRELLALEKEISEMKSPMGPKRQSASDEPGAFEKRFSLIEKMTGASQTDGSSDTNDLGTRHMTDSINALESSTRIFSPMTPETPSADPACSHDKDLTDSSGERYATPFTHFSLSRPLTPQPTVYLPAVSHTSISTPSTSSVV